MLSLLKFFKIFESFFRDKLFCNSVVVRFFWILVWVFDWKSLKNIVIKIFGVYKSVFILLKGVFLVKKGCVFSGGIL